MAKIRIDITGVNTSLQKLKSEHSTFNRIKSNFSATCNGFDYKIKSKSSSNGVTIGNSINTISRRLNNIDIQLKNIEKTIEFASFKYSDTESRVIRNLVNEYLSDKGLNNTSVRGNEPKNGFLSKVFSKGANLFEIIDSWSSKITDFIDATAATFNAMIQCIVPYAKELKIGLKDGTYRIYGKTEVVRDLGLARWYKPSTVASKPNVDKIFKNIQAYDKIDKLSKKLSNFMDDFGGKLQVVGGVIVGANEFFVENKNKPVGEKITDTTIEVGIYAGKLAAGTAVGSSVGTWIGGVAGTFLGGPIGTAAGAAIGAAIGTGVGIVATWITDKAIDKILNTDLNKDGKGFKDTIKDAIGNAANKTSEFIGNIGKSVIGACTNGTSNSSLVFA